jgi:hypothetical protein
MIFVATNMPLLKSEMVSASVLVALPSPFQGGVPHPYADVLQSVSFGEHQIREALPSSVKIKPRPKVLAHCFHEGASERLGPKNERGTEQFHEWHHGGVLENVRRDKHCIQRSQQLMFSRINVANRIATLFSNRVRPKA